MFLLELFFAIIFSFFVTSVFVMAGSKGPWNNLGVLFVVVLLLSWAGGIWITPIGPSLLGGYWLPGLIMALLIGLLLVSVVPHKDKEIIKSPEKYLEENEPRDMAIIASLGIAFWIFVCGMLLTIAVAYFI